MKVILFLAGVLLASCGARLELGNGRNGNNVVVARSEEVRANLESKNERELVVSSLKVREPGAADGGGKWLSGAVTFRGLDERRLWDFGVIPESGGEVFSPRNGRYTQVDGGFGGGGIG